MTDNNNFNKPTQDTDNVIDFKLRDSFTVAQSRLEINNEILIPSQLDFLLEHNGIRPAQMHLFLGLSGGGKSTLFRTLLFDYYLNKQPNQVPAIWLSEESEDDFAIQLVKHAAAESVFKKKDINFYSEVDKWKNPKMSFAMLDRLFEKSDIVFFDNLTTSNFYKGNFESMDKFVGYLKNLVKKHQKPLVIFAHTGGQMRENGKVLLEQNDIRGPKTICNLVEFLYIMQQFHVDNEVRSTLRIVKSRSQEVKKKIYEMQYNSYANVYSKSFAITFDEFKDLFNERNKL